MQLGFAYQLRWRETADASFLPRSEAALRRAAAGDGRATPTPFSGSARSRSSSTSSGRRSRTGAGPSACSGLGSTVRRHRRRARRARAVRRGVRRVRANGVDPAEPRVVCPRRVRPRADRRPSRCARGDAARTRRCCRPAGADRVAARRARQARARFGHGSGGADGTRSLRSSVFPGIPAHGSSSRGSRLPGAGSTSPSRWHDGRPRPSRRAGGFAPGELLDRAGRTAEARRQRSTVAVIDRLLEANGVRSTSSPLSTGPTTAFGR